MASQQEMKNNELLNEERMSSVEVDLESQCIKENQVIEDNMKVPLKGILKTSDSGNDHEKMMAIRIGKLCSCLLYILFMLPITTCDLYFGLKKNTCIQEYPDDININLQTYLLVSGFLSLLCLTSMIVTTIVFEPEKNDDDINGCFMCVCSGASWIISVFYLIWHILGAVIFWGYLYKIVDCNKQLIVYMFTTLIIKLISVLKTLTTSKKKE